MATKAKNKGGRPSKKNTIDLIQLTKLAARGFTDKELADFFNVSEPTLNKYKKDKEFLKSLKEGKDIYDNKVVRALYERAMGYEHPEEKIFCDKGEIVRAQTIKKYPPDPTSMIFWLKNRDKANWRDRIDQDITSDGEKVGIVLYCPKEES